jgi:hypothetical protein
MRLDACWRFVRAIISEDLLLRHVGLHVTAGFCPDALSWVKRSPHTQHVSWLDILRLDITPPFDEHGVVTRALDLGRTTS